MKKLKYLVFLIVFLIGGRICVLAQNINFANASGKTVQIEAEDGVEWDRLQKKISAVGEAVILYGDMKLKSERIDAFYHEKDNPEIFKFIATNNVVFTSADITINGETAIYDIDKDAIEIKGNPAKFVRANETILAYDKMEYLKKENKAIATGKASIISDGKKLTANIIEAYFIDNKEKNMLDLNLVKTFGGVEINTDNEKITANQGYYDVKKSIATLKGNVIISQKENQLRGEEAEVNLITGISKLKSNKDSKQRVKGSFVKEK